MHRSRMHAARKQKAKESTIYNQFNSLHLPPRTGSSKKRGHGCEQLSQSDMTRLALMTIIRKVTQALAIALAVSTSAQAQAPYAINTATTTVEQATLLSWSSETNTLYRISYADQIIDPALGYTVWNTLYDNYLSHGTNTFVADAGNYDIDPQVPHPKYSPMRFYRIENRGQNNGSNPAVSITSPGDGATLSDEVTVVVSAASDQMLTSVRLYVDGEEQYDSDDGTNFVINTTEWADGPHRLFAVAKAQSGFTGLPEDNSVTYGSSVSSYVNVTFNNLITRYDFSQAFFVPGDGQTQTVSAVFAANANWSLQVQDESSNVVRSVTGSGTSMSWDFNGNDSNGTQLPPALYWYVLTAQTNGLASLISDPPGGDTGSDPPPLPNSMMTTAGGTLAPVTPGQAIALGMDHYYAEPPPYPPEFVNGKWLPWEEVHGPIPPLEIPIARSLLNRVTASAASALTGDSIVGGARAEAAYAGPSSQTSKAPQRKPKQRHIGVKGTFGYLYQDYPDGLHCRPPKLLYPIPPYYVKIDGYPAGGWVESNPEPETVDMAKAFKNAMVNSGYTNKFCKGSGQWTANDLKGSSALINTVNLGVLNTHASYGETVEAAGQPLHTYIWLADGTYIRLNDMRLGAPGPNGLRWMTLVTCNTLRDQNIQTYLNQGWMDLIISANLHLLLGSETTISVNDDTMKYYAQNLKNGETLVNAWYHAVRRADTECSPPPSGTRVVRIMGRQPCFGDKLMDWSDPEEGISSTSAQVYP